MISSTCNFKELFKSLPWLHVNINVLNKEKKPTVSVVITYPLQTVVPGQEVPEHLVVCSGRQGGVHWFWGRRLFSRGRDLWNRFLFFLLLFLFFFCNVLIQI